MENIFITKLILEKVRNLDYIEIPLSKDKKKHLIFTGRNGSGKTTILDGLSEYFNELVTTNHLELVEMQLSNAKTLLSIAQKQKMVKSELLDRENDVRDAEQEVKSIKRGFDVELNGSNEGLRTAFKAGNLVIA